MEAKISEILKRNSVIFKIIQKRIVGFVNCYIIEERKSYIIMKNK